MTRGAELDIEALGPPPPAGASDSSSDVLKTVEWSHEGQTRAVAVRRIPGWSWGVQLDAPWADGIADLVHETIDEHGLVILAPPAVPPAPAKAFEGRLQEFNSNMRHPAQ